MRKTPCLRTRSIIAALLFACWQSAATLAGPFDPPPTYYDTATGTGATLQGQLHDIIDNHVVFTYGDARTILQDTDVDPNNPDNIILVYDRVSLDISGLISGVGIPGWDSGVSWNREHTWPRSRGVDSSGADFSDLHQLRPATPSVNSSRSNLNFGGAFGMQPFGSVSDGGVTKWYPGDADAGMIARQEFYVDVRYDGSDANTEDLVMLAGNPSSAGPNLGDKNRMIEWHFAAPPDDFELRRNDVIYDSYQGNRIPFVDRPEFVWSVFVDQNNDSRITIDGAAIGGDGSTTLGVDLGRVLVGAAVPGSQLVDLSKSGNDGTYYEVTTSGDATSSVLGRYNAFRTNTTDSTTLDVGLSTSTATAGLRSGSVTIDNLDITTGGGVDRGANDGNDVINVTLDVLDHANPSLDGGTDIDMFIVDFGIVAPGGGMLSQAEALHNLENTAGFTAALDLDSIGSSGDDTVLTTNLSLFFNLAAGGSNSFDVFVDTALSGAYAATYSLTLSDEDVPGETTGLAMTLTLEAVVTVAGDGSLNGEVGAEDYTIWANGFGTPSPDFTDGDYNNNGDVGAEDYTVWANNFGLLASGPEFSGAAAAVPEPSALVLAALGLLAPVVTGCRRRRAASRGNS